jgi:hypothetical protein
MPIKYHLHQYAIAKNADSYKAVIIPNTIHDLSGIISQMLQRGTTLSEADILASLHLFFEVVTQEVQEGNHVNLPIVNIKPSISGQFTNRTDSFDVARHTLKASASAGILLKNTIKNATVEKLNKSLTVPILNAFSDFQSETINDTVTPNSIGQIVGNHLKFNPANPSEGLFFVNAANETFKATVFATLHPRKLIFTIPATMLVGSYTVILKKAFGKPETTLRKGVLPFTLKVV